MKLNNIDAPKEFEQYFTKKSSFFKYIPYIIVIILAAIFLFLGFLVSKGFISDIFFFKYGETKYQFGLFLIVIFSILLFIEINETRKLKYYFTKRSGIKKTYIKKTQYTIWGIIPIPGAKYDSIILVDESDKEYPFAIKSDRITEIQVWIEQFFNLSTKY